MPLDGVVDAPFRGFGRLCVLSIAFPCCIAVADHLFQAKGKKYRVGVGRLHASYEAYMDAKASSDRPLNGRASKLLCRPGTHGTILVMKTTFINLKSHGDAMGSSEDGGR